MNTIFRKIEGNILLDHELILHGLVTGNITVVNGGTLILHGLCSQNIEIGKGAKAYIHGLVAGNVLNRGGRLEVYGTISGFISTIEEGVTLIDPNAIVAKGSV